MQQIQVDELRRMMTNADGEARRELAGILNAIVALQNDNRALKSENKKLKEQLGDPENCKG